MSNKVGSITGKEGIEALCIAVLQQAAHDYFLYKNTLKNPKKTRKEKAEAEDNLDRLISDFQSGYMDLYTMVLPSMDGSDVLTAIEEAYKGSKRLSFGKSVC